MKNIAIACVVFMLLLPYASFMIPGSRLHTSVQMEKELKKCEESLPRTQKCKLVAIPEN